MKYLISELENKVKEILQNIEQKDKDMENWRYENKRTIQEVQYMRNKSSRKLKIEKKEGRNIQRNNTRTYPKDIFPDF